MTEIDLQSSDITVEHIIRNAPVAFLYEEAIKHEQKSTISAQGALIAYSGTKTGRSPADKRVVEHPDSKDDVWWGPVNIAIDEKVFNINRSRAIDYLNTREKLYCVDAFAGWDPKYRIKVRVICARPYHALFMLNMLIRPTEEELASFGEPDCTIYNAGAFPANRHTVGMTSKTSVDLSLESKEVVILGTENDDFFAFETEVDTGFRSHPDGVAIGRKRTCVVDRAVGFAERCQFFFRWTDEHVEHE